MKSPSFRLALVGCLAVVACGSSSTDTPVDPGAGTGSGSGGCGDIGTPAAGSCVAGLSTGTPIRGLECATFGARLDGAVVTLDFNRKRLGKTYYDGTNYKDSLAGCSSLYGPTLLFNDGAGVQRLEVQYFSIAGVAQSFDAHTQTTNGGCGVVVFAWAADGTYIDRFVAPTHTARDPAALAALQSGTVACDASADPTVITFTNLKLVNLFKGTPGDHTLELSGTLSTHL